MSIIPGIASPRPGAVINAGRVLLGWWAAYTTWRMEQWAISRLRGMSDRQLKDIGVVRSQIEFAVKGARA